MKNQAFNGEDLISVINDLTEFQRASDSLRVHEGTAVWLF